MALSAAPSRYGARRCVVLLGKRVTIEKGGFTVEQILRHEASHCNGTGVRFPHEEHERSSEKQRACPTIAALRTVTASDMDSLYDRHTRARNGDIGERGHYLSLLRNINGLATGAFSGP